MRPWSAYKKWQFYLPSYQGLIREAGSFMGSGIRDDHRDWSSQHSGLWKAGISRRLVGPKLYPLAELVSGKKIWMGVGEIKRKLEPGNPEPWRRSWDLYLFLTTHNLNDAVTLRSSLCILPNWCMRRGPGLRDAGGSYSQEPS